MVAADHKMDGVVGPRVVPGVGVFHVGIFKLAHLSSAKEFYFFDMRPGSWPCAMCSDKAQRPCSVAEHPKGKIACPNRKGEMGGAARIQKTKHFPSLRG